MRGGSCKSERWKICARNRRAISSPSSSTHSEDSRSHEGNQESRKKGEWEEPLCPDITTFVSLPPIFPSLLACFPDCFLVWLCLRRSDHHRLEKIHGILRFG